MNTVYRTFTSWSNSALAAGFERAADELRQSRQKQSRALGGDNVIDLTAWREANLEEFQAQPDWEDDVPELEPEERPQTSWVEAPRRERRNHRARYLGELISTVSVVAAAAVLILRVLTF